MPPFYASSERAFHDAMELPEKARIRKALSGRRRRRLDEEGLERAAVLVPFYEGDGELYLLLTKRTETLSRHKGEISFPGGGVKEGDADLLATALREAAEEVGLKPEDVEIVGELDDAVTAASGFVVTPLVGFIPYPYPFQVNQIEIAELIHLPFAVLRQPWRFRVETRTRDGKNIPVYFYTYGPHVIWGLTARILNQLLELIDVHSP